MVKKLSIFSTGLLLVLNFSACKGKLIEEDQLLQLKKKYSKEAINYFYETVFNLDYVGPTKYVSKWNKDIFISMEGDLWPDDSLYVINTISQLNQLQLPIKLHLTGDSSMSNVRIYFGDYKVLERKLGLKNYVSFLGIGLIPDHVSSIEKAIIGIANDASTYSQLNAQGRHRVRHSIILEEITQVLGITGDAWSHYNSIFFEGRSRRTSLSKIDTDLIRLLYEQAVRFIKSHKIPYEHIQVIKENSFYDQELLKFPNQMFVHLKGSYTQEDLEFSRRLVKKINAISKNLQINVVSDSLWYEVPGITIQFEENSMNKSMVAERFLTPGGTMYNYRLKGLIKLSYQDPQVFQKKGGHLLLATTLLRIIGLDKANEAVVTISNEDITIQDKYERALSLLYNPVFPNGFSMQEMDEVMKSL